MTVSQVIDPNHWTPGWLWLIGALAVVAGFIFAGGQLSTKFDQVVSHVELVEKKVDGSLKNQADQHEEIIKVQGQLVTGNQGISDIRAEQKDVKANVAAEHDRTTAALNAAQKLSEELTAGRAANLPRIDVLEKVQAAQATTLAVVGQKLDDISETVKDIKDITQSHDKAIQKTSEDAAATRAIVAPKDPRGH